MRRHTALKTSTLLRSALAALLVAAPLVMSGVTVTAEEEPSDDVVMRTARGRTSYRIYCQNCHGKDGHGDGTIAELLKVPPADLTLLSAGNDGEFPADKVYLKIDGREEVRGHGPREMPIWGFSFQDPNRDEDQEAEVRERLLDLIAFLRSIQTKEAPAARR